MSNGTRDSALHKAWLSGSFKLVRLLLNNGATIALNLNNKNDDTPLMYACQNNCVKIVQYLL